MLNCPAVNLNRRFQRILPIPEKSLYALVFDFVISQSLTLHTMPTDEEVIFAPEMHLYRKSGEPAAWARMNHRFLKLLRQQFLLWRILSTEERDFFAAQARILLGIGTDEDRRMIDAMLAVRRPEAEAETGPAEAGSEQTPDPKEQ